MHHSAQHSVSSTNTLLFEPAPLLDEAHEGSDSCPRADHDHWVGGFEGQAELRLADVHGNSGLVAVVCDQFVLQPVGGNSLVDAASFSVVLHHYGTDVDAVGVNLQNRGELLTALYFNSQTIFIVHLLLIQKLFITLEEEAME